MEDYVTSEQAKILKELGFDWECNHWYHPLEPDKIIECQTYCNHNSFERPYSAPTLAQAQKWLREKYKLWLEPTICISNVNRYSCDIYDLKTADEENYMDGPTTEIEDTFDNPEQALSAGIGKALELLKQENK